MRKGNGWNSDDRESMKDFGPPQDWHGANLSRKSSMSDDLGRAYRSRKGAVSPFGSENVRSVLGVPTNIPTPASPGGAVIREIHTRGEVGFGVAGFEDVLGKATGPAKP